MTATSGSAWSRVNRVGQRFGGGVCSVCGHEAGRTNCMSREDQAALDQELKLRLEEWGRSLRADAAELVVSFLDLDESERGRLLVQVLQAPAGWNLR